MRRPSFIVASSATARSPMIEVQRVLLPGGARLDGGRFEFIPRALGVKTNPLPGWIRCIFQVSGQIGKLLHLRGENRRLHRKVFVARDGLPPLVGATARRHRGSQYLAIANELRCEPRRAAALARGTTENQSVAAVLDNRVGVALPIGTGDLGDRLESEDAAPIKFSQPCQRILESIDLT